MNTYFNDIVEVAQSLYGEASVVMAEVPDAFTVFFGEQEVCFLVDDDTNMLLRVVCGDLEGVERRSELLKEFLLGGYFWSATDGAVLSIGDDGNRETIWLTERVPGKVLVTPEGISNHCESLLSTARLWGERMELYKGNSEDK